MMKAPMNIRTLAAAVLAADSSGTVANFESTLITAINAITLP